MTYINKICNQNPNEYNIINNVKKNKLLWMLGNHKLIIPLVTFLTPLASNFDKFKDQ